jgi:hypothetical protein
VKYWTNDPSFNCKKKMNMKKYMKLDISLADDNYDLIEEAEYFKELHIDDEI